MQTFSNHEPAFEIEHIITCATYQPWLGNCKIHL